MLDFRDVRPHPGDNMIDLVVHAARLRAPLLLVGAPGCGKTMLAARLPGILPALASAQERDLVAILGAARLWPLDQDNEAPARPFRAPHDSISAAGMAGDRFPGEVALASHGVLFLDEIDQFRRQALEATRDAAAKIPAPRRPWIVGATCDQSAGLAALRLVDPRPAVVLPLRVVTGADFDAPAWPSSLDLRARVCA